MQELQPKMMLPPLRVFYGGFGNGSGRTTKAVASSSCPVALSVGNDGREQTSEEKNDLKTRNSGRKEEYSRQGVSVERKRNQKLDSRTGEGKKRHTEWKKEPKIILRKMTTSRAFQFQY
jgi:hypothetical protein